MSGVEFDDWIHYFNLHPYGTEWDDVRMAVLSANICAALTGQTQKPEDHQAKYKSAQKMSGKKIGMIMQSYVAEHKAWQTRQTSAK